jgi:tetratricopeptide (TPR) repeat protein
MRREVSVRRRVSLLIIPLLVVGCASVPPAPALSAASVARREDVLALVAEAQLRLQMGAMAEGIQLFRKAVALAPHDEELREEFGLALHVAGLDDEAEQQLASVRELSPSGSAALGTLRLRSAKTKADLDAASKDLERGLEASGQTGQTRFQLVQVLLDLGRADDAWNALQPLLADHPQDSRLQLLAGEAQRLRGHAEEAIPFLERAAASFDTRVRASSELVEALVQLHRYDEAAKRWKALMDHEGTNLAGLARYATLLLRAGKRDEARKALDDLLARDPDYVDALTLKALLAAEDGDFAESERLYRHALAKHPDDPDVEMGFARLLVELRRMSEARGLIDKVWAQVAAGKLPKDAGPQVAEERAALELVDHRPDDAHVWLERLGSEPLDHRSVALWVEYFRQEKAYRQGLDWLGSAHVASDSDTPRLMGAAKAEFLFAIKEDDKARAMLGPLLKGSADDVNAALSVLDRAKRYAEMIEDARTALARLKDAGDVRFALAAALERSGQFEPAAQEFRALIAKEPDNASALNYLGYMLADKGIKLEEARSLIERAVKLDPSSGAYVDSLGWVYFRLGDLNRAEQLLTHAVTLDPHDATVREHLGDVLKKRGEAAKAVEQYRQALAAGADDDVQKQRLEEKLRALGGDAGK